MFENQNIEYKESWRLDYLDELCSFANTNGGSLLIGVNDKGEVVGVKDSKKLMEDIPNQIKSGLNIIADIKQMTKDGKDYLEIRVNPSSYPISYKGEYYVRSGSTKQKLTGPALTAFITKKTGFKWEDVTVDNITVDDLDGESIKIFKREALRSGRMSKEELNISNEELMQKLNLMSDGKLKRSAVLLFYHNPSIVQSGSIVMIGRFNGADILYQDVFEGSMINTADKVVDLIFLKYLKAKITYDKEVRIETYPYSREAIREAVYNAIIHNCYMYGAPIQIRIEDRQMIISNCCILPDGWTIDTLNQSHQSMPYNPEMANTFYRAGYIEHWGRGIQKINDACKQIGAKPPVYELIGYGLRVYFEALESALIDDDISKRQNEALNEALNDETKKRIAKLILANPRMTQKELIHTLKASRATVQRKMNEMKAEGIIEFIGSKKKGKWIVKINDVPNNK